MFLTGPACALALRLFGERSTIAGFAEASTAGNAIQTPLAVSIATALAMGQTSHAYEAIIPTATAQISISVIVTAILCPIVVVFVSGCS